MSEQTQNVTQALVESLKSENLQSASVDILEVALDACLSEGVFKDIPILGTILGIGRSAYGFRDLLFAKKVARFLMHLAEIPAKDREAFVQKLSADDRTRIGETVIGAMDKIETAEKSDFIGRLFRAFIQGKIDFDAFRRLVSKICNCPLPDLLALNAIIQGTEFEDGMIYEDLSNAGFMRRNVIDGGVVDEHGETRESRPASKCFEVTDHGNLFAAYAFH